MFGNIRLVNTICNYFKRKKDADLKFSYKKYGIKKEFYHAIASKDFKHLPLSPNWLDEGNSRMRLPEHPEYDNLPWMYQVALTTWSENGFVVLSNFFEESTIEKANASVEYLLKKDRIGWQNRDRLKSCYKDSERLKAMGEHPHLIKILELLLGKEVELFQSKNYIKASEEASHSDAIHLTTYPLGNSIAVWIALEDITAEQAPLHFYAGSHKLPYILNDGFINASNKYRTAEKDYPNYLFRIKNMVIDRGLSKRTFIAKKGDIFIWHANLLHGYEAVSDKTSTRKSMVFHYFTKDVVRYSELLEMAL